MKLRKGVIVGIVVLILLLAIGFGGLTYYKSKTLKIDIAKNIEVLVGDKLYNTDAVKNVINGKIITKKEKIDTSNIGKKTIKITIEDFFKKKKDYKYDVIVKDEEAPVIKAEDKLTTEYDTKIDLLKNVSATDNYDKEIKVEVVGDYDLKKAGEYKLQYIAKDSSGNEAKKDVTLVVKEKVVIVEKKEENTTIKKDTINNTNKKDTTNSTPSNPTPPVESNPDGSFTTSNGFHGETRNGITYVNGILIANKTYSLPSNYNPGLLGEFNSAFANMKNAAASEGIALSIVSGFRSYNTQQTLYNRYVARDGKAAADRYSARPGHSEHQSGLAADLNQVSDSFGNTPAGKWLANNCWKYGFILRYPKGKESETGYMYESWHFRYIGNVEMAEKLYNGGNWLSLENYLGITSVYGY